MSDNLTPAPPVQPAPSTSARTWHMWCHLSALAGFFCPFGNILGPLIVWQTKKHDLPSVDAHGKAAVNFQLTVTIVFVAGLLATFALSFICIGYLLAPLVIGVGLAGMVFAVIAGIKANDGQDYRYPYTFNLL